MSVNCEPFYIGLDISVKRVEHRRVDRGRVVDIVGENCVLSDLEAKKYENPYLMKPAIRPRIIVLWETGGYLTFPFRRSSLEFKDGEMGYFSGGLYLRLLYKEVFNELG